ncbi:MULTISPECIES: hypothetical protein [Pseudidiomarina]|uniref:Uncharacterized protein n=3 Tax=Pseudidiomarina TaxID=2800384 RepID=A0A368UZX9_9GAMM|nr:MULTISPECIES: hypothetical protein [Pseudidiomarina]PWW14397.1 hypothetical protein DET45_10389 [Pseudidiomarina maritima]RBP92603.1 hypothetical protein DFO81_102153 [Pseudidiomarina tainanensis]RCW34412.1 hypothetical protein DFO79_103154 [Pseudidiomarina tainanensis]
MTVDNHQQPAATNDDHNSSTDERHRVYQVSANRGRAKHKMRYVESMIADEDSGDCRLCRGALAPNDEDQAATTNTGDQADTDLTAKPPKAP